MRLFRHARRTTAATAALCAAVMITTSSGAAVAKAKDPSKESRDFRKAVTVRGVAQHLDALQKVADANNGTRASGTPGYTASRNYVVQKLRAAGYRPTVQTFAFPYFEETAPATLQRISPSPKTYADPADFSTMTYSGSGDVTAAVVAVDTNLTGSATSTSGCEPADFAAFPAGAIALMQRGTCAFAVKAANAEASGAAAVVVFNRGVSVDGDDGTGPVAGTLGEPGLEIPAVGTSFATGQELGAAGTQARLATSTISEVRNTYNVIADTRKGNPDNVVMAGGHLDSVVEGPGINDNGSGSATILEVAEQLAKVKKLKNKVRFAFWGAEELSLLGSQHYVDDLVENNPDALGDIALYLNLDMVGSPNFVRFVYDGDNSSGGAAEAGPEGSAEIESLFTSYFASQGLATEPTPFDGRSDYGPFIANNVPAGGLFTGAEDIKTPAQARIYGGTAGVAYDPCYHQACDTRQNISMPALDQMSDATAHAVYVLSRSTKSVNGQGKGTAAATTQGKAKLAAPGRSGFQGHQPVR